VSWLLCLPVFATTGWVWFEVSRLYRGKDYNPAAMRRFRRQGYVAVGCFQLSVAGAIVALNLQEKGGTWVSAISVGLMGLGFVVAGLWHPLERLLPEDDA
jgi:hypothetical protein